MGEWIDFRELRTKLDFSRVLEKYDVRIGPGLKQATGPCPLPGHSGSRSKPSFSANLEKGIFQCFSCHAKGNLLEFACLMEARNPENGSALRAVELVEHFKISLGARSEKRAVGAAPQTLRTESERILVNAPLDFELKDLNPRHPYLAKRGLSPDTVKSFGLGYCLRGYLKGRIAIPIHNGAGELVGYAGRAVDADGPKYLFPGHRTHKGTTHEFQKSRILYNANRIEQVQETIIVVEGFASVWWLHEHGMSNVVALMGSTMSDEQEEILRSRLLPTGFIYFLFDGDDAGERARESIPARFKKHCGVAAPVLPAGKQPTDLDFEELENMFQVGDREAASDTVEMICRLINDFPCFKHLGINPENWDAGKFEKQSLKFSSKEISAAQFVLGVWNPAADWKCGRFDLIEAAYRFDDDHRHVIIRWLEGPWWL
jgi:DNA primase